MNKFKTYTKKEWDYLIEEGDVYLKREMAVSEFIPTDKLIKLLDSLGEERYYLDSDTKYLINKNLQDRKDRIKAEFKEKINK